MCIIDSIYLKTIEFYIFCIFQKYNVFEMYSYPWQKSNPKKLSNSDDFSQDRSITITILVNVSSSGSELQLLFSHLFWVVQVLLWQAEGSSSLSKLLLSSLKLFSYSWAYSRKPAYIGSTRIHRQYGQYSLVFANSGVVMF